MTVGEFKKFCEENNVPDSTEMRTEIWDGDYSDNPSLDVGHPSNSLSLPGSVILYP